MTSAERLRERLGANDGVSCLYQNEALYHAQIDWVCQLLDMVDEAADPVTAAKITDLICDRLAGDSAGEAWKRLRDAEAELKRLRG